jgi:5-dehydro-2-deoxygluconokinase
MTAAPGGLELLTVGRVSVDLYAEQVGAPLRDVQTFRKSVGGTATNVAVAAARLGHQSAVWTRVGADAFGDYVRWALEHTFGVDTRFVGRDATVRTPLAFAELCPPEDPTLIFYREPRAPDMNLTVDDLGSADAAADVLGTVPIFWVAASNVAWEPSRSTMHAALAVRGRRRHTVLDLDWRPQFWSSATDGSREIGALLDRATIAIGNRAECEIAVGTSDPDEAADRLLGRGLEGVVVKLGGDGVMVATSDGRRERVAPFPVEVVCGLGAGDAFGGAFCHGLLSGWDLAECARLGNAAGAIVASRLMCADDMPTLADLDALVASTPG